VVVELEIITSGEMFDHIFILQGCAVMVETKMGNPDSVLVDTLYGKAAENVKALVDQGYNFVLSVGSVEGRTRVKVVLVKDSKNLEKGFWNAPDADSVEVEYEV
jgi:hypothetical protein